MGNQYYEAILQLRHCDDQAIELALKIIEEEGADISKIKELKNGSDLYLSSRKTAVKVGKALQSKIGGQTKVSKKLHSRDRQSSKELYRVNVLFKQDPFKIGDVIKDKEVFLVTGKGKEPTGINLKTGKKTVLKGDFEKLEIHKTTISKVHPQLEALHPETYESTQILNPQPRKLGEKVKVVVDNKLWLIK